MRAAPLTEDPAASRRPASADEELMALSLVTLWAMRTGRTPPPGPYTALSAPDLLDFWADPDMTAPGPDPDGSGPGPNRTGRARP